jgi:hypothetical protein
MTMNDPRRPSGRYFRDGDNSRIGWAVAALVAVVVFGFVWIRSDHTTVATNPPPMTTGQGNLDGKPTAPPERPPSPDTPNLQR